MNVIGSRPDGWWRDRRGAMRSLASSLAAYAEASGAEVTVVFDGRAFDVGDPPIAVRFAPGGPNAADDQIVKVVAADDEPRSLTVVTSDSALADRVRAHGSQVIPAGSFRRRLPR